MEVPLGAPVFQPALRTSVAGWLQTGASSLIVALGRNADWKVGAPGLFWVIFGTM